MKVRGTHGLSVLEALLVTFLWSTSYILVKISLENINPLALVAYRYIIASIILVIPTLYHFRKRLSSYNSKIFWLSLSLGFTGYFLAQGLQSVGLYFMPATTVTFILNLTPLFVVVLGIAFLQEKPTPTQFIGVVITLSGILLFFEEDPIISGVTNGIIVTLLSSFGWAVYMIVTRHYLRDNKDKVMEVTAYSMTLGSLMLLTATFFTNNVVNINLDTLVTILWLSIVNTSIAFILWNYALKTLKAYEQSILQNTMLIQIAILANIFLGESLTLYKIGGILIVFTGTLIVQLLYKAKSV